jgi:hypothetical protein
VVGEALVRAPGPDVGEQETVHADVLAREVVAGRERGLEEDARPARRRDLLAVHPHDDAPRRVQHVDPVVRVARVDDDLVVLLEPRVDRVPRDADVALDRGLRLGRDAHVLAREREPWEAGRPVDEPHTLAVDDGLAVLRRPYPAGIHLDEGHLLRRVEVEPARGPMPEGPGADGEAHPATIALGGAQARPALCSCA